MTSLISSSLKCGKSRKHCSARCFCLKKIVVDKNITLLPTYLYDIDAYILLAIELEPSIISVTLVGESARTRVTTPLGFKLGQEQREITETLILTWNIMWKVYTEQWGN